MFEIIMLLGFLYAATSQIRSRGSEHSKEDSEERSPSCLPGRASHFRHSQYERKPSGGRPRDYMRAA